MKNFDLVERKHSREKVGNTAEKYIKIITTHAWKYRLTGDIIHEVQTVLLCPDGKRYFNHYWTYKNGGTAGLAYWIREIKKRAVRPY